ncbi:hypothetical protein LVJ94_34480 [Pendulispora rubella]|uniref:Uncharacterized protein n=1 Tax=Pendulispora rubella TaxID=2741070 RepID=A0ABZ2L095_9BACT
MQTSNKEAPKQKIRARLAINKLNVRQLEEAQLGALNIGEDLPCPGGTMSGKFGGSL